MSEPLPAMLGGPAVNPVGPPEWPRPNQAVVAMLQQLITTRAWGQYHGPYIGELEDHLRTLVPLPFVHTCASGTLAMETALRAVGVGPGDHVIMGAYEYEPNFLTILQLGATPVLIDCQPTSPAISPEALAAAITPTTKAIIATHLHGGLVDMPRCREIAGRIPLIEDAAQVPGAMVHGQPVGHHSDACILSFGGSKLLSAGRGGAVLFRDAGHAQRAKLFLSRGVQQWAILSEVQAAILLPQLAELPQATRLRAANVQQLVEELHDVPGLRFFSQPIGEVQSAYYKWGFYLEAAEFGLSRERFVQAVRAEGIAVDVGFRSVHIGRAKSRYVAPHALPNATDAAHTMVILHHPVLSGTVDEVALVTRAIRKTHRHASILA